MTRKPFRLNVAIVALVFSSLRNAGSTDLADKLEAFQKSSKRTSMFRPSLTQSESGEIAEALLLAPDVSQTNLVKDTIARLKAHAEANLTLTPAATVPVTAQVKDVQPPQTSAPPVVAVAPVAPAEAVASQASH